MEKIVEIQNVSVRFNLASEKIDNLKEYFVKIMKHQLMFQEFFALKNISIDINTGEAIGIIGRNGAGKSTLLKVISGILEPYKGSVQVNGKISPLIELGAGFDVNLTARENIYLNGCVLGYSKNFLDYHFNEIVDFAEIQDFLDVPIKNYSSGMVARLGFSIATIVKPDILIVDEILSVGDIKFRQKCEERMNALLSGGTTLIYVSHSIDEVKKLCQKALWLENGECKAFGPCEDVCNQYLQSNFPDAVFQIEKVENKNNETVSDESDGSDLKAKENLTEIDSVVNYYTKIVSNLFSSKVKSDIEEYLFSSNDQDYLRKIYNRFLCMNTEKFFLFLQNRIVKSSIDENVKYIKETYNSKICIYTDIQDYNFSEKVISIDEIPYLDKDYLLLLICNFDWNALRAVEIAKENNIKYMTYLQSTPTARYFQTDEISYKVLIEEWQNNPRLHFCSIDFENIFQAIKNTRDIEGVYVEIGTYQGASARAALNYLKYTNDNRKAYFIDTFQGFSYDEAYESTDAFWSGTHADTSIEGVGEYLCDYSNKELIKANIITDNLPEEIKKISLCNVDVDMEEAVYAALEKVHPLISQNGIIIAEDYGHTPLLAGAQYATKKFLEKYQDFYLSIYLDTGQMLLIRK